MSDYGQHRPMAKKAAEMLTHGAVHGKPLTKKQRGLFAVLASGKRPRKPAKA